MLAKMSILRTVFSSKPATDSMLLRSARSRGSHETYMKMDESKKSSKSCGNIEWYLWIKSSGRCFQSNILHSQFCFFRGFTQDDDVGSKRSEGYGCLLSQTSITTSYYAVLPLKINLLFKNRSIDDFSLRGVKKSCCTGNHKKVSCWSDGRDSTLKRVRRRQTIRSIYARMTTGDLPENSNAPEQQGKREGHRQVLNKPAYATKAITKAIRLWYSLCVNIIVPVTLYESDHVPSRLRSG